MTNVANGNLFRDRRGFLFFGFSFLRRSSIGRVINRLMWLVLLADLVGMFILALKMAQI